MNGLNAASIKMSICYFIIILVLIFLILIDYHNRMLEKDVQELLKEIRHLPAKTRNQIIAEYLRNENYGV